jgi:hypothetical protein
MHRTFASESTLKAPDRQALGTTRASVTRHSKQQQPFHQGARGVAARAARFAAATVMNRFTQA